MARGRSSNNVRAGLFVLAAIMIAFAFVVALGGLKERLKPRDSYTVRFTLAEGASGLDIGSPVKVAGRPVGRVSKITLRTIDTPEAPAGVDCEVKIDRAVRLYGDPVAFLNLPLLGSGGEINFPGVGDPSLPVVPNDGSAALRGTMAPPTFLAQAGYGEEQKAQLQRILQRGDDITADVKAITADARTVSGDVRENWPAWSGRIDNITKSVEDATASLPGRIEEFRETLASARQWIDENKAKLTRIVDNVEVATEDAKEMLAHFNEQSVAKLDALLDEGRQSAADARAFIDRADSLLAETAPGLRRTFANLRLGSDQLKLTLGEIRRTPWRLLYRPDTRELEFELLYDAARAYAEAASDLRAAGESLDAAASRAAMGAPGAPTESDVAALAQRLRASFETYGAAEAAFLKLLVDPGSSPRGAPSDAGSGADSGVPSP